MRYRILILIILVLFGTGCSDQSLSSETATPVKLPPTWTHQPTGTSTPTPEQIDIHTSIPTLTPTTDSGIISDTNKAEFEGADQWWLRLPESGLIHASGTNSGGMLMLVRSWQGDSDGAYTALKLDQNGSIKWQKTLDDLFYPTGILETRDGGILIMEPQTLHKMDPNGLPLWTRFYSYSDISRQAHLFNTVQQVRPAGNGTQVIGLYGDITTLDQEGKALDVDLDNISAANTTNDLVAAAVPGGSYLGEQESRTVYRLTRRSNTSSTWDVRFDFIYFDITLFPPHFVLGTMDGGALFIAPAPHIMGDGAFSIFIARLDRSGGVLWQRIYKGIYEDDFIASELSDGGFLIANTHSFYGQDYSGSYLRLTRLNSSGYIVWDRVYGDGATQIQIKNIIERPEGGFFVIGHHGYRGENDNDQGTSLLSVDSQGLIPGCKFLAEVPKAEMLAESSTVSLSQRTPNQTRIGELSPSEKTDIEFNLADSDMQFEVNCAHPSDDFLTGDEAERASERIHSFVDADGLLIGGVQKDVWYSASEVASQMESITTYHLYNLSTYVGDVRAQLSSPPDRSKCPENTYLRFEEGDGLPFRIGLDGNWNAVPRIANELNPNIESYRNLVQNKLKKNGIKNPEVEISSIYQIDLDGDGGDEILIFANHFKNGIYRGGVFEGDYSLLFLRKLKGNDVVTVPLYERYVTADFPEARAAEIELYGLIDLNGDGVMEILAGEKMSKAYRYHVYDSQLNEGGEVLSLYCGE